jgi:hypothetical protein
MKTIKDLKDYLWHELELDTRSITFHVVNDEYFGSGIVEYEEDLLDSDAFAAIRPHDWRCVTADTVESFMLGDGESDHADYADIDLLDELHREYPELLQGLLDDCADCLASMTDVAVFNPDREEHNPYDDYDFFFDDGIEPDD